MGSAQSQFKILHQNRLKIAMVACYASELLYSSTNHILFFLFFVLFIYCNRLFLPSPKGRGGGGEER